MRRRRWHEIPAIRNALGMHSPSQCASGKMAAAFTAGITGKPYVKTCGCSCRRCRRAHRPDSPPGLVLREEVAAAAHVGEMRRVAAGLGITSMFDPIPHEPGSCEECDRRRAEARHEETP